MQQRLSNSVDKKNKIRERWKNYIQYRIDAKKQDPEYDPTSFSYSILTLSCKGLLDVKTYLDIEDIDIDDIVTISDQPLTQEFQEYLNLDLGLPEDSAKKYFFHGRVEQLLGKKIFKRFDLLNLDFSNTFYNPSKIEELYSQLNPQGIVNVFQYMSRFNNSFTIILTNKIDDDVEYGLLEFNSINNYIMSRIKETFLFLPTDEHYVQLQVMSAILCDVSFIALDNKFILSRAFTTIYSPENTYHMFMTILEFDPLYETIFEYYLENNYKSNENISKIINNVRSSILKIRRI